MQVTIEMSMYPLSEAYLERIQEFIDRLNANKNITVKTNATSTHITGEYDLVMGIVQKEIKTSYEKFGKAIFVIKVLLGELAI